MKRLRIFEDSEVRTVGELLQSTVYSGSKYLVYDYISYYDNKSVNDDTSLGGDITEEYIMSVYKQMLNSHVYNYRSGERSDLHDRIEWSTFVDRILKIESIWRSSIASFLEKYYTDTISHDHGGYTTYDVYFNMYRKYPNLDIDSICRGIINEYHKIYE